MTTRTRTAPKAAPGQPNARQRLAEVRRQEARRHRNRLITWGVGLLVAVALVVAGILTSLPTRSSGVHQASDFTLTDTSGAVHRLSDLRGKNVLLYFSEGAGCQICIVQMGEIAKRQADFDAADVVVLPIVMNSRDQILADMAANHVTTPFLLDDGRVSEAYGTLGKGMHAGLPGHSFVLVDKQGQQRWYGEYPSMWLSPDDLLKEVGSHLA
ncbi:Peroxiredoxin [Raineyella antarctica]|uniref:Peroxiredoxin n=1 Tax=Raineyella antarctica TaxID=1577474 RepID=A0A1G6GEM5_9ACTN|nr:peroxiredoxin family protein [Raineyella antarctica]SDB80462.1 Peroxiredoxin [Raineyella antarctica]